MAVTRSAAAGLVASSLLASLTLVVFSRNQMSGPEGALHAFITAIGEDDHEAVVRASGGSDDSWLPGLRRRVYSFVAGSRGYVVEEVRLQGGVAGATVIFFLRDGRAYRTQWMIRKKGRKWVVDTEETARLFGVQVLVVPGR